MYVKNNTGFNQQFKAAGNNFSMKPGATASMTEDELKDHTTQFLLARGVLVKLDDDEGLGNVVSAAQEAKAKAEANKMEVVKQAEDTTKKIVMVRCAAAKKDGSQCSNNVQVKVDEYDENAPYFCGTHKNEDADKYERADGRWQKKAVVEVEPEPEAVEEPAISDDDIAAALAEAMEEDE